MLIDSNAVLVEAELKGAAITGDPVGLTSLKIPGKFDCLPIYFSASPDIAGGTKITVKLQQADTKDGVYADVDGSTWEATTAQLQDISKGARVGIKWMPRSVTKPWVKMVVTPTGSYTKGKVFAAVTREDYEGYEPGLYIKGGKVVG